MTTSQERRTTPLNNAFAGYTVSVGYMWVLFDYMSQKGMRPEQICQSPRLREIKAADADARYPLNEWCDLMEAAEALMEDPLLALTLSEHIKPWHTGLVGYLAMTSDRLLEVGKVLERFHQFLNDLERVSAGVQRNVFVLRVSQLAASPCPRISLITLGSWAWHARWLTGHGDLAFGADFTFGPPDRLEPFDRVFGGEVRFNQAQCTLLGAKHYLDLRVVSWQPKIHRILHKQAELQKERFEVSTGNFLAKFERVLIEHISNGAITLSTLASEMSVSPRTLQYKLEDAGLNFRSVVERVRKNQAISYLHDSNLSLIQIALLLGFATQSSFHHAFKRWTGRSPGEFRRDIA